MMRVIAGKHRNRKLQSIDDKQLRPTAGHIRESIFNILSHGQFAKDGTTIIEGANVLDLFCGTGALGIEALSRGAKHVVFVDVNQKHLDITRSNLMHVGEETQATLIRSDSSNPPPARYPCNLVFLDPPYKSNLIIPALKRLKEGNWLTNNAVIVLEMGKEEYCPELPLGYTQLDDRVYGRTRVVLLEWEEVSLKPATEEPAEDVITAN